MGLFGVHVHQHAVGGSSLAAMAGDGIAVVEMRMFVEVEMHFPPGVQPNLKISFGVGLFHSSELAIGNMLSPVGSSKLHTVARGDFAFRAQSGPISQEIAATQNCHESPGFHVWYRLVPILLLSGSVLGLLSGLFLIEQTDLILKEGLVAGAGFEPATFGL